ncbi:hypothetical protein RB195_003407 [Necator americanus]|uniref:7TM chemoreceptor n=1 Tax=Necator americanus TaxID=51031 RepID=A0ABR1DNF0_NECAM
MDIDISIFANINAYVSGAISICANTYLMIAISRSRVKAAIGLYRWMMVLSTAFDIVFSTLNAVACPTIAAVTNMSSVLFVKGGLFVPHSIGRALLNIWIALLCLSIIVSPCLFVFRYFQLCRRNWVALYGGRIFFVFLIPVLFSLLTAFMLNFAAYPSPEDIEYFSDIAYSINVNGYRAFLVASLTARFEADDVIKAHILIATCVNLVVILVCSLSAMIVCSRLMVHAVKDAKSVRTVRLQNQLQKSLLIQFIIPFLFIQLPFCSCCLAPLLNLSMYKFGANCGIIAPTVSFIASILSILLNCLLIFVAHRRKSATIGLYRYMIISSAAFDVCFSTVTLVASPTIASISNKSSVLFKKAGIKMPHSPGRFVLVCWIYLLAFSMVMSPCHFIFRYIQMCRNDLIRKYGKRVFIIFTIPSLLAIVGATMLCFSAWPSATDIQIFGEIAFTINTKEQEPFLVASLLPKEEGKYRVLSAVKSALLHIDIFYLVIFLAIHTAVMIFCSRGIVHTFQNATSKKTARLQQKFHRLLILQFCIPFLFIHTPFCICCLAPLFNIDTGIVANYLPILFALSPAINPLIFIYFSKGSCKYDVNTLMPRKQNRLFILTAAGIRLFH